MSFEAYASCAASTGTMGAGNVQVKADPNLNKGQDDGVTEGNQPSNYKAKNGWFRVLLWNYQATANFNASSGVSTGNITDTYCTLLKYHGQHSAFAYRAMFNRTVFDI